MVYTNELRAAREKGWARSRDPPRLINEHNANPHGTEDNLERERDPESIADTNNPHSGKTPEARQYHTGDTTIRRRWFAAGVLNRGVMMIGPSCVSPAEVQVANAI